MQRQILPHVIFSPGRLALSLAEGLRALGASVTLFTPGPVDTTAANLTADLSYFTKELAGRGDTYVDLLKKHPFTFITLARQVQAELIARAYAAANRGDFDVIHIYTNEEDTALPFAQFCHAPVVFTHHDPFNFLVKYKNVFPKYASLPWVSLSYAQRSGMPADTNWAGNVYHGLAPGDFTPNYNPAGDYLAYLGRIIEPKGLHLAIAAAKKVCLPLKIAGRHYSGKKDAYWQEVILPQLGDGVEYVGFIDSQVAKQEFLGNARALLLPSIFEEPFGLVAIEALACSTPVIGLKSGAIPEVIMDGKTGFVVSKNADVVADLARAITQIPTIDRRACRLDFERRFTAQRMCADYLKIYGKLTKRPTAP